MYSQIRHANRLCLALLYQPLQLFPLHLAPIRPRPRRVDEEQIDIAALGRIDEVDRLA